MAYGARSTKKSKRPNFAAAQAAHLRALERQRRESAKGIITACKKAEEIFQAERKARIAAASSSSSIQEPRLSRKEARSVAAAAAKQQRRRERRAAEAEAEATELLANDAIRLARKMFALRLDSSREEDEDDEECYKMETWPEFKARVLSWHGLRRKYN
ncbi:hypothetical protein OCU04_004876 [Sclerotinia nivalis]|uniref:Uncharacterized protein n=1 Tax=Sclerotinia nivalis TaxID=352851 RepID=A0A9X0ARB8_9HELO|nr:hypothetical protein OCU04_004876 [Sclerotinia nivalis]